MFFFCCVPNFFKCKVLLLQNIVFTITFLNNFVHENFKIFFYFSQYFKNLYFELLNIWSTISKINIKLNVEIFSIFFLRYKNSQNCELKYLFILQNPISRFLRPKLPFNFILRTRLLFTNGTVCNFVIYYILQ